MTGSTAPEALTVDLAALRRRNIDHHAVGCELPVAWLRGVLSSTDAEASQPAQVALGLHLQPRGVVVATGTLQVAFAVPCGRCLTLAPVGETARIVATFVPAASPRGRAAPDPGGSKDDGDDENALGLSEDDLDTWTYEGVTLSLEAMLAEQVKLVYPMRVLCARGDDCRGLCSNCGADLNAQAPDGRTCEACGRPVPKTPVADPPSSVPSGASAAAASRASGPDLEPDAGVHAARDAEPDPDRPENPLAAALKKLMS